MEDSSVALFEGADGERGLLAVEVRVTSKLHARTSLPASYPQGNELGG